MRTLKSFAGKRDEEGLHKFDLNQSIDKVLSLCHAEIRRTAKSFELLGNRPTMNGVATRTLHDSAPAAAEGASMNSAILLVDDEHDFLETTKRDFEISGYRNLKLLTGPVEAVQLLESPLIAPCSIPPCPV